MLEFPITLGKAKQASKEANMGSPAIFAYIQCQKLEPAEEDTEVNEAGVTSLTQAATYQILDSLEEKEYG